MVNSISVKIILIINGRKDSLKVNLKSCVMEVYIVVNVSGKVVNKKFLFSGIF